MDQLIITGKLKHKGNVKMVGQNADFPVQNIYVDISNNEYENFCELQLAGTEKVTLGMDIQPGDKISVYFNIKGKSYDKKDGSGKGFFQSLNAWRIVKIKEEQVGLPAGLETMAQGDDDLPF